MKLYSFLHALQRKMGYQLPNGFGLVAHQVDGVWVPYVMPGGVVHLDEVHDVQEVREFIPAVMDSPPWREER